MSTSEAELKNEPITKPKGKKRKRGRSEKEKKEFEALKVDAVKWWDENGHCYNTKKAGFHFKYEPFVHFLRKHRKHGMFVHGDGSPEAEAAHRNKLKQGFCQILTRHVFKRGTDGTPAPKKPCKKKEEGSDSEVKK